MAAGFKLRAVQKSVRAAWQALPEPRSTAERIAVYQEIKAQYEVGGALTRRQDAALARMVALLPAAPQAPAVPRVAMTLAVLCIIYALLLSLNVLVVGYHKTGAPKVKVRGCSGRVGEARAEVHTVERL